MGKHKSAVGLEEQARACEYDALFGFDALRPQLLEHMPVLDEAKYARSLAPAAAIDMSTEPAAAQVRRPSLTSRFCWLVSASCQLLDKARYASIPPPPPPPPAAAIHMSTEPVAPQVRRPSPTRSFCSVSASCCSMCQHWARPSSAQPGPRSRH